MEKIEEIDLFKEVDNITLGLKINDIIYVLNNLIDVLNKTELFNKNHID